MRIRLSATIIAFSMLFVACGNKNKNNSTTETSTVATETVAIEEYDGGPVEVDPKITQASLFISGVPVTPNSEFHTLAQTQAWKNFSAGFDALWSKFDSKKTTYVQWAEAEIYPKNKQYKTLFYPFSGADFLYANIFFPDVEKMYMFGLENVGSIPCIDSLNKAELSRYLDTVRVAISAIVNISFFRTKDMKNDMANKHVDGVAPILMVFLTRSGKEVLTVKHGTLDDNGNFVALGKGENINNNKYKSKLLEVTYRNPGENKARYIYYFGGNVADYSLKHNAPYVKFLENIEPGCATFVKSASYLMHDDNFSTVRNTVLAKSDFIFQDDSGVPHRFFDPAKWNVELYGVYTRPIPLFKEYYEADLSEAYANGTPKPMNFRMGYNNPSNERIITRK